MTKSEKLILSISLLLVLYGIVKIVRGQPVVRECQEIGRDVICETQME